MSQAVLLTQPGGPEVLQFVNIPVNKPASNQVQVRHTAIEVNYIDIYHRTGVYPLNSNPKVLGVSAVGIIEAVGEDIRHLSVGDRVAYATAPGGAYSTARNIAADLVFGISPEIEDKVAAAVLVKGMTAHYLATRAYITASGRAVLIHAAAGGTGQILVQICRDRGAYVIGTAGSDEKVKKALEAGCHAVLNHETQDWVAKVKEYTLGYGVNAVYDSIGQKTIKGSIECLMEMGILVLYGASSGSVDTIDTNLLAAKSLFFTRPSLFHYKKNRMELVLSAEELWRYINEGVVKPNIYAEFPLSQASEAHKMLESRKATGSIILVP